MRPNYFRSTKRYHWQLEAWAVFVNHYHFVARGYVEATPLNRFIKHLHANTARQLNALDGSARRQVWYNFWDTKLTYERSYLAHLNYVHQNAVKHGLVRMANQYSGVQRGGLSAQLQLQEIKSIYGFKIDKLNVDDDY